MKISASLLLTGLAIAAGLTYSSRVDAQQAHKMAICHGTASSTNPYVLIIVDYASGKAHLNGTDSSHGQRNYVDFKLGDVSTKAQEDAYRKAGDGACNVPSTPGS